MKRIIRLTESELVSLVKRTIMEDTEDKTSIQSDILTYQGTNKDLLKFQQIQRYHSLSDEQLNLAKNILDKENNFPIEVSKISEKPKVKEKTFSQEVKGTQENEWKDKNTKLLSRIIELGKETYNNIKNTEKKYLYSLGDYEFSTPNETWIGENKDSLLDLKVFLSNELSHLVKLKKINNETRKLEDWIKFFNEKLEIEPEYFTSLVKKDDKSWTDLPKIDTNYTNWAKWIDKLNEINKLGNGDKFEKLEMFFNQQPLEEVIKNNEDLNLIKSIEKVKTPTISFAEYELFKDAKDNFLQSKNSISNSTRKGNDTEREFIEYLNEHDISSNHIINFSTPGNQVDMVFGIDYIVKLLDKDGNYRWTPIQVKSSESAAKKAELLYNGLYGLSVFKSSKNNWYYFRPGNTKHPKSFNENFMFSQK